MRIFILLLLLCLACNTIAAIYIQQNQQSTTFSDMPLPNSQRLDVSDENNISLPSQPNADTKLQMTNPLLPAGDTPQAGNPYQAITITAPQNGATIQNQATLTITVMIKPQLKQGHKIQALVDGKVWGEAIFSNQITLSLIPRGSHAISVAIIDHQGKVLAKSETITLFIQKASVLRPVASINKKPKVEHASPVQAIWKQIMA
jgi:hypothetical protein